MVTSEVLLALVLWTTVSTLKGVWEHAELSMMSIAAIAPTTTAWVGLRVLLGMYPGYGLDAVELLRRHTHATFATLALLAISVMSFQIHSLSRLLYALVFLGLLVLAPFVRHLVMWGMRRVGAWGKPVVVLGYKDAGANLVERLKERWELGYDPVAVFDYSLGREEESGQSARDQRALPGVMGLAREYGVDTAIFAMPHTRREQLAKLVGLASISFRHVMVVPNLNGITNSAVVARDLAGTFAVEIKHNLLNPWALRTKRIVDLVLTAIGGGFVLPLVLLLGLLVYLESGWPVFYSDRRMGKDGKLFSCVKFRSMASNAEVILQRMLEENADYREEYLLYHKLRSDPRCTRVGRFLRKTSLDELPQLWNVLKGEMTLVGPRPYLPRESEEIGVTQSEILRVPPGITGPWQVSGRNHTLFSERVRMDANYVRDWSIWLDIVLLARTVKALLFDRAAY